MDQNEIQLVKFAEKHKIKVRIFEVFTRKHPPFGVGSACVGYIFPGSSL